jgi:AcrR family transcriptional regulator
VRTDEGKRVDVRTRAARLSAEDRRAALLEGVIPLLQSHGRDISTRQIADACGVAEGTIFRAFGTKEALIEAAIDSFFDPRRFREMIAAVSPTAPVEQKIRAVLELLQDRLRGVVGVLSAIDEQSSPRLSVQRHGGDWIDVLTELLAPNADELALPVETVGRFLRAVAVGASLPHVDAAVAVPIDELVQLVAHGVLARHDEER